MVDTSGVVIAGNGTLAAARKLEWETILVVETDLAGERREAFAVADNRTAELATWNHSMLCEKIESWEEDLAIAAGWTQEEIESLTANVGAGIAGVDPVSEPEPPPGGFPKIDETISTEHQCPKCGYEWSGSIS